MYNDSLFNQYVFNKFSPSNIIQITDDIIFNWYWLKNASIIPSDSNDRNIPAIDLRTFYNPVGDGGGVLRRTFTNKDYTVSGILRSDTAEWLQELIDEFKKNVIYPVEWYLKFKFLGAYRQTRATVIGGGEIFDRKHYNITFLPYSITFRSVDPHMYDETYQAKTWYSLTSDFQEEITNGWTYDTKPKFIVIFDTATGVDTISLSIGDTTLSIAEDMYQLDILEIDCENMTVKKNNVEIDYQWTFPKLAVWSNIIRFLINGTKSFNMTSFYRKTYL